MADFEKFYPLLAPYEGGYLSAADAVRYKDKGGETYRGIARNANPDWKGWLIIDEWKRKYGIPKWNSIIPHQELNALVKERARKNYWDAFNYSEIKNQSVANFLADFTFNSGAGNVLRYLGEVLKAPAKSIRSLIPAINKAPQKDFFEAIQAKRTTMIKNSGSINPDHKPQLIKRSESFFFEDTPVQ